VIEKTQGIKTLKIITAALLLGACMSCNLALAQPTYTFTPAGAIGTTGPTQLMVDTAYTGTTLDGDVTSTAGIQFWVVPMTGPYQIEAFGGQGYGGFGGRGAHMTGEFNLTAGDTLKILVGQMGAPFLSFPATTNDLQFGGGGGSFVTLTDNTPLVVAGGGGGNHDSAFLPANDGQITEAGAAGTLGAVAGAGGSPTAGGSQANSADGGGGLLGDGDGLAGGQAFVSGGLGGSDEGTGGFGGGGGTSSFNNTRGGGGGGYSGGGGSNNNSTNCCAAGGGGGSFNAGTSPVNLAGVQLGDGLIIITNITTYTVGVSISGATGELTLQNNIADDLLVPGIGDFVFGTELADTASYAVTVSTQPAGQMCSVSNGTGAISSADVLGIDVVCVDNDPVAPKSVPTMSVWGIGILVAMMGALGMYRRRRL
jgi:hypothetical protein